MYVCVVENIGGCIACVYTYISSYLVATITFIPSLLSGDSDSRQKGIVGVH
jgi:hypothetical protein